MFSKAKVFFERNYTIDCETETIVIDHPKKTFEYIADFVMDWWQKTSLWFLFSVLLLKIYTFIVPMQQWQFASIGITFLFVYAAIFFVFNIMFICFDYEWLIHTQMFFEEIGHNIWFWKWKTEEIYLNNESIVSIEFYLYIKYKLFFHGLSTKLSKIDYQILKKPTRRVLTLKFKEPITGNITLKYRGLILKGGIKHGL